MEKTSLEQGQPLASRSLQSRTRAVFSWQSLANCVLVLVLIAVTRESWLPTFRLPDVTLAKSSKSFENEHVQVKPLRDTNLYPSSWDEIKPGGSFDFKPCGDGFECARLEVPMDRQDEHDGDKVILAVIKMPAKVPVTDPNYGGAVFMNPGGPGGSGVHFLRGRAKALQTIIDTGRDLTSPNFNDSLGDAPGQDHKYYDVISWDPRGVGETFPPLNCFPDPFAREVWSSRLDSRGLLGSTATNASYEQIWSASKAVGEQCAYTTDSRNKIALHMNTPTVVMDMVDMLERYGEWREKQAAKLLGLRANTLSSEAEAQIHERTRWKRGGEKLNYWGFSYGTVLGATFAAMQPERVERVILDGVVDSEDYYSVSWRDLNDADAIMGKFAEYCYAAGPDKCAFHTGGSSADILTSLELITASLAKQSLVVAPSQTRGPEIITYADLLGYITRPLYSPYKSFEPLAEALQNIRNGNGSIIADWKAKNATASCPNKACRREGSFGMDCQNEPEDVRETTAAIGCSDGVDLSNETKAEYQEYINAVFNQSRWLGEAWATAVRLSCVGWRTRPKWDFTDPIEGNTSFPLLFLSTTYDPVTPLSSARTMSRRFPGSGVAELNSEGHCTISSPSLCNARIVRAYFQKGELPAPGTVCLPDVRPFGLSSGAEKEQVFFTEEAGGVSSAEDVQKLKKAAEDLSTWSVEKRGLRFFRM